MGHNEQILYRLNKHKLILQNLFSIISKFTQA